VHFHQSLGHFSPSDACPDVSKLSDTSVFMSTRFPKRLAVSTAPCAPLRRILPAAFLSLGVTTSDGRGAACASLALSTMTVGGGNLLADAAGDTEMEGNSMSVCDEVATIAAVVRLTASTANGTGESSGNVRSVWHTRFVKHAISLGSGAEIGVAALA
jgi:hypothetical protein